MCPKQVLEGSYEYDDLHVPKCGYDRFGGTYAAKYFPALGSPLVYPNPMTVTLTLTPTLTLTLTLTRTARRAARASRSSGSCACGSATSEVSGATQSH